LRWPGIAISDPFNEGVVQQQVLRSTPSSIGVLSWASSSSATAAPTRQLLQRCGYDLSEAASKPSMTGSGLSQLTEICRDTRYPAGGMVLP